MSEPDNLPAVRTEAPSTAVVRRDTDSWADQLPAIVDLARSVCLTDFVPESLRDNVAATAAAIMYGREVGLPPMTALSNVNVIKGKPGLSAVIMRAQVLAAGHEMRQDESNSAVCKMSGRRRGTDYWQTVTYTIDDARQAGHMKNDQYTKNPRRMLRARATSELCELMFADVVRGMPSLEELEDLDDDRPAGPPAKTTRATVQRKRTKTDDGAEPAGDAPAAAGTPAAPSSPPMPPLPGEPGFDELSAAAKAEPDAGAAAAAQSADGEPRVPAAPASTPAPPLPGEEDLPEAAEDIPDAEVVQPADDITDQQRKKLFALMAEHGLKEKDQQIGWMSKNLGRELTSRSQVNKDDAIKLIDLLESLDASPRPVSRGDLRLLAGLFKELEIADTQERLHIAASIIGRTPPSAEGLTAAEANTLLQALGRCKNRDQVEALVQMAEDQRAEAGEQP